MNNFTPTAELVDLDHETIAWDLALPDYAPSEAIGVHVPRLGRLARLGGFRTLRISGYSGDTTSVSPEIDSVDDHGVATSTMRASVTKAKRIKLDELGPYRNAPQEYRWSDGGVSLNITEIDRIVGEKGGLRKPDIWSSEINSALKLGVRQAAKQNLIENTSLGEKMVTPALLGFFTVMALAFHDTEREVLTAIGRSYLYYHVGWTSIFNRIQGRHIQDRRWSLFEGIHLDRALAVNGISRALPLAKEIKD
jgi:hypothetical protein